MKLVIGNKNYSSWSLRPWLLLKAHGVAFVEQQESLNPSTLRSRLSKYSDSCKVPVLIDEDLTIWDSLSICEYVSEKYLNGTGWPQDSRLRSLARSVSAEMHSSFSVLRTDMPMNCRLRRVLPLSNELESDIDRIRSIWASYASEDDQGDLRLFGQFGIADCFFAPVALRFETYGVELDGLAKEYQSCLLDHPKIKEWVHLAEQETETLDFE